MAQDPRAPQPVGSAPAWGIAGIILGLGPLLLFGVAAAANLGGPTGTPASAPRPGHASA